MEMKSLSSKQVRWAQKLSCYYFQIDYYQDKANGVIDTLSQYLQQSAKEEKTLRSENVKILHRLQSSLARVSSLLASHLSQLSLFHQVLICKTTVLPRLRHFWDSFRTEMAISPYASVGGMKLQLSKLQENDKEAKLLRGSAGLPEGWKDVEGVF